jgi:D-alanyl-D-alanine carboxypeptidase
VLRRLSLLALLLLAAGCQSAAPPPAPQAALAQPIGSSYAGTSDTLSYAAAVAPGAPQVAAIVIDAETGRTLYAEDADSPRYPASLTKLMTLYILFEEMEAGRIRPSSQLVVSPHAASQPPSRLGLKPGSTIAVEDAIRAIAVRSSNDVAITVAENVAGSEPAFVARMNRTARALGLGRTAFRNPSGLPDPGQVTTARDMATLGLAVQRRFPRQARYFALRSFSYAGRTYESTNELLGEVRGMDGMKTGYTRASGYNLVGSVRRDGRHLVAVVLGERSSRARNAVMANLIETHLSGRSWLTAWR